MQDFTFRISPNVILGTYASSRLGELAGEFGSKFMVIIDPILKEVGLSKKILQSLTDRNMEFFIFNDIIDGATSKTVEQALALARNAHVHGIIAIGGGKTLITGQAVAAYFNSKRDFYSYLDGTLPDVQPVPLLSVPTTLCTPFIFNDFIPITDSRNFKLRLLKLPSALCKLAIYDPNLTVTLPDNQNASMILETLCTAFEAYVSRRANFFSDMIIEKAMELLGYVINDTLTPSVTSPHEILLSQAVCLVDLGAAISSVGAASLLSLCINTRYHISRSLSTAILFPYIIEDTARFKQERVEKLAQLLQIKPDTAAGENAADALIIAFEESIRQRIAKANLPARLKELSLSLERLAVTAGDAADLDLMAQLPRSMTADELFEFIKRAW